MDYYYSIMDLVIVLLCYFKSVRVLTLDSKSYFISYEAMKTKNICLKCVLSEL